MRADRLKIHILASKKHGLKTPILETAFVSLSIYQRGRELVSTALN